MPCHGTSAREAAGTAAGGHTSRAARKPRRGWLCHGQHWPQVNPSVQEKQDTALSSNGGPVVYLAASGRPHHRGGGGSAGRGGVPLALHSRRRPGYSREGQCWQVGAGYLQRCPARVGDPSRPGDHHASGKNSLLRKPSTGRRRASKGRLGCDVRRHRMGRGRHRSQDQECGLGAAGIPPSLLRR